MEEKKIKKHNLICAILAVVAVLAVIVYIVIFVIIQLNNENSNNLADIQKQINSVSNYYSIYTANDKLILLGENLNKDNQTELQEIIKLLKENASTTFKNYSTLICIDFLESSGKENELTIKQTYSLPNFEQLEETTYIKFDTYKELYNTYEDTMDKYTDLFMSIGR